MGTILHNAGHVVMERSVEASDLQQTGVAGSKRLDERDLTRQVFRVVRADSAQFLDQLWCDVLGLVVPISSVNDAMPDGGDPREPAFPIQPVDEQTRGRLLVRSIDQAILLAPD